MRSRRITAEGILASVAPWGHVRVLCSPTDLPTLRVSQPEGVRKS